MPPKIRLEIVTAERLVYSDDVDVVVAPGEAGELAILPRHAPLLTSLKPGVLRIRQDDDETTLAVSGGFLEVEPNRVIVLADTAERAEEIDVARAAAAEERARALLAERSAHPEADRARALAALQRSTVRLRVARQRHRTDRPPRLDNAGSA